MDNFKPGSITADNSAVVEQLREINQKLDSIELTNAQIADVQSGIEIGRIPLQVEIIS